MKPMIGVGVFGKQDMISWMLDGISSAFQTGRVVFFFEACTDLSKPNFLRLAPEKLAKFEWTFGESASHILEHGVHNWLIQQFMASDCDVLIVPHDDNKFVGSRLLDDICRIVATYGDKTGWISGRDGYEAAYANMISSPFSASNAARAKLKIGEFQPRSQMNTGPVVYTRKLIEKIGGPSMAYEGWYWWDDYALTAKCAGLQNVLLGMDCLHEKFGTLQNNAGLYDGALVARDLDRLQKKWRPILGYNPI
jgi:hypothetical protein